MTSPATLAGHGIGQGLRSVYFSLEGLLPPGVQWGPYIVIGLGELVGGVSRGITGTGSGITALSVWVLFGLVPGIDTGTLDQLVLCEVLSTFTLAYVIILFTAPRRNADLRIAFPLLSGQLLGAPVGTFLLQHADVTKLKLLIAIIMTIFLAFMNKLHLAAARCILACTNSKPVAPALAAVPAAQLPAVDAAAVVEGRPAVVRAKSGMGRRADVDPELQQPLLNGTREEEPAALAETRLQAAGQNGHVHVSIREANGNAAEPRTEDAEGVTVHGVPASGYFDAVPNPDVVLPAHALAEAEDQAGGEVVLAHVPFGERIPRLLLAFLSACTGVVSGCTGALSGMKGPMTIILFHFLEFPGERLRATATVMAMVDIRVPVYILMGAFKTKDVPLYLTVTGIKLCSGALGIFLNRFVNPRVFAQFLNILLIIATSLMYASVLGVELT